MDLLLDTHTVLWFAAGASRLRAEARGAIESAERTYVSASTIWELAIKQATGRLVAPDDLATRLNDLGFLELPIGWEHARVAGGLPMLHRDPFDRILVAQAIVERLTIVTSDGTIGQYGVPVIAA